MQPYTLTNLINLLVEVEDQLRAKISNDEHTESRVLEVNQDVYTMSTIKNSGSGDNEDCSKDIQSNYVDLTTSEIIYKRERIGSSISGLPLYMITITGNDSAKNIKKKKGIFLTARVHPGENSSSFVMQGIIRFLTGNTNEAKALR